MAVLQARQRNSLRRNSLLAAPAVLLITMTFADELHKITCPALALVGAGEGEEMLKQTREFYRGISSKQKKMRVFTLEEDGSHDHCMLDNHSRMHHVTFAWLNEVFRTKPPAIAKEPAQAQHT
jgi:hypothetical protein